MISFPFGSPPSLRYSLAAGQLFLLANIMQFTRGIRKSIFGRSRNKLASGLDFQDAGVAQDSEINSPPFLHRETKTPLYVARNQIERERTQDLNVLTRSGSLLSTDSPSMSSRTLTRSEKFNIWMINEG